jgi:predicted  nucleic acid-binding Zn-ribbon protein
MNPAELAQHIEVITRAAKTLSGQGRNLLAEVAKYQLERDEAKAELEELQRKIDELEDHDREALQDKIDELTDELKEERQESEARGARIEELLELVSDLAELAHVVDPSAVEYALYTAKRAGECDVLGDVAARLRIGAQVRQASLPFGKAANR